MVVILVAALAGVMWDRFQAPGFILWLALASVSLLGWFVCVTRRRESGGGAALMLFGVAATAGLWHHVHWRVYARDDLGHSATRAARPVCLDAKVLANPRHRPAARRDWLSTIPATEETRVLVEFLRVRDAVEWRGATGRATVVVKGRLDPLRCGDRIRVYGVLIAPPVPLNPGETSPADFERSYRRLCRVHAARPECITLVEHGSRVGAAYWTNWLKDRFADHLNTYVHGPRAGLAAAILLGTRDEVEPQRNEDFMKTGTIHLLAISGLNVGILAYGFWIAGRLGLLRRSLTLVGGILFVSWYAVLTDAEPPVVRAAVLVSVMCLARLFGRESLNFNTLAAAGLVVLALNPASVFLVGTQLSFLAVATIACIAHFTGGSEEAPDPLDVLIAATRPRAIRWSRRMAVMVWQSCVLSAVIWLVALPLVLQRFHVVSPIAVVLNPIICIPMAIALFAGFGVMVFGWFLPPAAALCGWVCDWSLATMEWCIEQSLRLPGNHAWLPSPPAWWVVTFYASLLGLLQIPAIQRRPRWLWAFLAAWMAIGASISIGPQLWSDSRTRLDCTFIAVGHGTSVLLELPDGRTMLYDAGRLGPSHSGSRLIASVLWGRGIRHLDAMVLSHADADHFNAVPDLLERFSVGAIYVSPTMFAGNSPAVSALKSAIESNGISVRKLARGDRFETPPDYWVDVLHPPETGTGGSDNANSIVLSVRFAGHRLLLPGDLEPPGMEQLLAGIATDADVLMAPHHGSAQSAPEAFAKWSTPETVVISGAWGHDSPIVRRLYEWTGARVLHTAYDGAVRVTMTQDAVEVNPFREFRQLKASGGRESPARPVEGRTGASKRIHPAHAGRSPAPGERGT